jgi:thiamine pyrophosphokinase
MRSVIFAGGDYDEDDFYRNVVTRFDLKIAADSGANFLERIGVIPDVLIGDMDSIEENTFDSCKTNGAEIIKLPVEKDEIDTELALSEAEKRGSDVTFVAGAFGNRLDQTFGVFRLMERFKGSVLFNERLYAFVINAPLILESNPGELWSIIPLKKDVREVSLHGFKYELERKIMEYLRPYGISNESTGYEVSIDPGDGTLLIFRYHSGLFKWVDELSIKLKRKR